MYMGIPVEAGTHKIELSYVTPGIKTGAILSGITWIVFFFSLWIGKNTEKKLTKGVNRV